MKRLAILLMAVMALTMTQAFAKKVKVACVGNSITYGAFIDNREKYHYPAQLQGYLGEDFEVRNFGLNGATLLQKGDYPYMWEPMTRNPGTGSTRLISWRTTRRSSIPIEP